MTCYFCCYFLVVTFSWLEGPLPVLNSTTYDPTNVYHHHFYHHPYNNVRLTVTVSCLRSLTNSDHFGNADDDGVAAAVAAAHTTAGTAYHHRRA